MRGCNAFLFDLQRVTPLPKGEGKSSHNQQKASKCSLNISNTCERIHLPSGGNWAAQKTNLLFWPNRGHQSVRGARPQLSQIVTSARMLPLGCGVEIWVATCTGTAGWYNSSSLPAVLSSAFLRGCILWASASRVHQEGESYPSLHCICCRE